MIFAICLSNCMTTKSMTFHGGDSLTFLLMGKTSKKQSGENSRSYYRKEITKVYSCTLHTMHNAFRKGISSHQFGEVVEQLAFDLHAWFKVTLV